MARILVVDDELTLRRLLALTIGSEHEIREAADGVEALELLRRTRPDVVVLDIAMPGLDGLDVCRAARAEPSLDRLGIIILSAYARRDDAIAAGADHYLAKPFSPLALLDSIENLLARQKGTAPHVVGTSP